MRRPVAILLLITLLASPLAGCLGGNGGSNGVAEVRSTGDAPEEPGKVSPPPVESAPEFEMTNQDGETVSSQDLRGKVVVATFIYTSCTNICPMLTSRFHKVQETLKSSGVYGEDVVLVSISMDPEVDTPERLKEFGDRHDADYSGWHFLRPSSPNEAHRVIEGFASFFDKQEDGTIVHSPLAIVIDESGNVSSYYHGKTMSGAIRWSADDVAAAALEEADDGD